MERFALTLFSPKGDHAENTRRKKRKGNVPMRRSKVAHASHVPERVPTQAAKRQSQGSIFRRKSRADKFNRDESYDLSAYLMFHDDPDAEEVVTALTEATTRLATAPTEDEERLIRFDFDPSASFDLGISPSKSAVGENYQQAPEPVFLLVDVAESEVTNSLAFGRDTIDSKNPRSRNKFKFNPHNQYLSGRYDAKRIERGLALLDAAPENDNQALPTRKPLHAEIEDPEGEMSIIFSIDEGISVEEFSVIPGLKQRSVKFKRHAKAVGNRADLQEQDSGVYIPGQNQHPNEDLQQPQFSKHLSCVILSEDSLSVNNTFAVERFISAPRLCKGTKDVPSVVNVISFDDENNEDLIMLGTSHDETHADSRNSFRSNVISGSKKNLQPSNKVDSKKRQKDQDFKRVWNHIAQLPNIEQLLTDDLNFDEGVGSRRSFGSPVGIEQFDERRPWRKPDKDPQLASINQEEALIDELKSRVQNILSQAIPTDINMDKKNIVFEKDGFQTSSLSNFSSNNNTLNKIKSRRRIIEATHSKDDGCETSFRSVKTGASSVVKLKERLRQIESSVTGEKIYIIPLLSVQ